MFLIFVIFVFFVAYLRVLCGLPRVIVVRAVDDVREIAILAAR